MRLIDADEIKSLLSHLKREEIFISAHWTIDFLLIALEQIDIIDSEALRPQGELIDKIAGFLERDENWEALKRCWLIDGKSDELRELLHKAVKGGDSE